MGKLMMANQNGLMNLRGQHLLFVIYTEVGECRYFPLSLFHLSTYFKHSLSFTKERQVCLETVYSIFNKIAWTRMYTLLICSFIYKIYSLPALCQVLCWRVNIQYALTAFSCTLRESKKKPYTHTHTYLHQVSFSPFQW